MTADVTLLGVMAYSKHREEGGCDSGEPDAFSAIPYYLDWIANNTGVLPPSSLV